MWLHKNGKSDEELDSKQIHELRMKFIGQIVDRFEYRENKLQADRLKGYLASMVPGEEIDMYFSRRIWDSKRWYRVQGKVQDYYIREFPRISVDDGNKIPEDAKNATLMVRILLDMDGVIDVPCIEMDIDLTEKVRKGELY
jgi:hypothetical protein